MPQALLTAIRDGSFITPERVRNYAWMMAFITIVFILTITLTANSITRPDGQPIGTDFSNVYAAGLAALQNKAATAYDWSMHYATQQQLFGADTAFYPWLYPPLYLFVATPLALLPYPLALATWLSVSALMYAYVIRRITPGVPTMFRLPLTFGFSGVMINWGHGQNGFFTAFLFGLGLILLQKRPFLAGLCFGALCYKPQLGILLPILLIASKQWRTFFGAALSMLFLCLASALLFGIESWINFLNLDALNPPTHDVILEQDGVGWYKIQSLFAALRNWGVSAQPAYAVQALFATAVIYFSVRIWQSDAPFSDKAATLLCGSLLVTPYCVDYDLVLLAPALAFLGMHGWQHEFRPYEKTLIAFLWFMPFIARIVMKGTTIPLGALSMACFFVFLICATYRNTPRLRDRISLS